MDTNEGLGVQGYRAWTDIRDIAVPDDDMDLLAEYEDAILAQHEHRKIQVDNLDDEALRAIDAHLLLRNVRLLRLAILERMEAG